MVGIEWRKDEAENRARRTAVVALVEKRLDAQLADALKREAAGGKPETAGAAGPGRADQGQSRRGRKDPPDMPADRSWLAVAVALSWRGRGRTSPNPQCRLHRPRQGWPRRRARLDPAGRRPHAEAMALALAGESARGGTAYVSLEPCAHRSARGPCCSSLLIEAGVSRVVVAATDPDPRTDGEGIARLRKAGIAVSVGELAAEARAAMAGFFTRRTAGPAVRDAQARDFARRTDRRSPTAPAAGSPAKRRARHAHLERAQHETILVGARHAGRRRAAARRAPGRAGRALAPARADGPDEQRGAQGLAGILPARRRSPFSPAIICSSRAARRPRRPSSRRTWSTGCCSTARRS